MPTTHTSSPRPSAGQEAGRAAARRVPVLLPLPLAGAYDYLVPDGLDLAPGDFVRVPLGARERTGVVWEPAAADAAPVAAGRLKPVIARLDAPPLPAALRRLIEWVADYTISPPGAVLRMAMSVPAALAPPRPQKGLALAEPWPDEARVTDARARVRALLSDGPPRAAAELAREAAVGPGTVRAMEKAGLLRAVGLAPPPPFAPPDADRPGPALGPDQAAAAKALIEMVGAGGGPDGFAVALLDGVTGAGKTEVYFEAAAAALRAGRQVLVLLPEIALGAQWLERFADRFGARPAQWHSDLSAAQRRLTWRAVADGTARVVVGARSALFLPFAELGLIVADEEHDAAFKQEDGVIYNARDMAVVRARLERVPAVLVSATPSLETVENVRRGRYRALHLPDRHGGASLPRIEAVDMRTAPSARDAFISQPLRAALADCLAAGEQAVLFLNRRGYAPLTLCNACGHRLQCPHCTAWLIEHRALGRLQCHHCGYRASLPTHCPQCDAEDSFRACGPGVERLAEELAAALPEARAEIMSSDTLAGPRAAAALLRRFADHKIDVLIGTQMIAKGHHFPRLTLVGVIDADLGLAGGDLRAAERTYQLLHQVSGRAGREAHPGRVLLQTYLPDHPVMRALVAGDRDAFLDSQIAARQAAGMPPFGRLAALILSAPDEAALDAAAARLARTAPRGDGLLVLGPAPAPMALLRGRHRRRFLVKAARGVRLQPILRRWIAAAPPPRGVRLQVDIDPYSFV